MVYQKIGKGAQVIIGGDLLLESFSINTFCLCLWWTDVAKCHDLLQGRERLGALCWHKETSLRNIITHIRSNLAGPTMEAGFSIYHSLSFASQLSAEDGYSYNTVNLGNGEVFRISQELIVIMECRKVIALKNICTDIYLRGEHGVFLFFPKFRRENRRPLKCATINLSCKSLLMYSTALASIFAYILGQAAKGRPPVNLFRWLS